jgi:putative PIN family toxin of toxin-antitoxin system
MRIVLDTNVLVSGLHNPNGAPGRIADLILGARIQVLYDDRILAEYLDVLARPQLAIEPSLAQAVVGYIRLSGVHVMALPLDKDTLPDPDDLPFAEVAITGEADMLVTGNMKHFSKLKERGVKVLSPAQCLERFI